MAKTLVFLFAFCGDANCGQLEEIGSHHCGTRVVIPWHGVVVLQQSLPQDIDVIM